MKRTLFWSVFLFFLGGLASCDKSDKEMEIIDSDPDPVDTMTVDTTAVDTIVYEDAPIWLPGDQEHGFAKGLKNGKEFEASAYAGYGYPPNQHLLGLYLNTYSEEGFEREGISIWEIYPSRLGNYKMNLNYTNLTDSIAFAFYATNVDDGDVTGDIYQLDTLYHQNRLEIIEVDTIEGTIKGIYNGAFFNEEKNNKSDLRNPDYCVFEDIYFECKIIN